MKPSVAGYSPSTSLTIFAATLLLVASLSLVVSASESGEYRDITIVSATESELIFTWRPDEPSWSEVDASGDRVLRVGRCAMNETLGEACIPIRKVILGIPPAGRPDVAMISSQYEDIGEFRVAVNKPIESSPLENALMQKAKTAASYAALSFSRPYFIRDQRVIELYINPARLAGTDNVNGIATEMTIRVGFNPGVGDRLIPSDDRGFERIFRAALLNYDQAANWRVVRRSVIRTDDAPGSLFALFPEWVRIGIKKTGIYRIDRSALAGLGVDVQAVDPSTIRLFWSGGRQLPVDNSEPRPDFRELAIEVVGGEDGIFDGGDYILFFMHGADFIDVDSNMTRPRSVTNAYTSENFVWLTYGGNLPGPPRRMERIVASPTSETYRPHEHFEQMTHYEENKLLSVGAGGHTYDYYTWYWHSDEYYSIPVSLDDYPVFQTCSLFVKSKETEISVEVNGREYTPYPGRIPHKFVINSFREGTNTLLFRQYQYGSYPPLLDCFDLVRPRLLRYSGGTLDFYTYNMPGFHRYSIESAATGIQDAFALNVSDLYNQALMTGGVYLNGRLVFEHLSEVTRFDRFALATASQLGVPSSMKRFYGSEFALDIDGDLLIVSPEAFRGALTEYISYRELQGYRISIGSVEMIYNVFSGGLLDPVAIRDYLKYSFETSPAVPRAALLVGDGCYDFRGYSGRIVPNFIPPFVVETDSTISDENYVHFGARGWLDSDSSWGSDRGVDMVIARWPVRSSGEVASCIAKLKLYENSDGFGPWRNLITLVADDEFKRGQSQRYESIHTRQSETLAGRHIPVGVDVQKIYLTEYPFDSFNQKPKARARIIQAFNDGTVLLNFIGHGSPDVWADERVFYWKEDLYKLTNRERPAVVFNASCSIGQFDSPYREGMAEELFRYPNGGAIATIAATRLVYPDPNAELSYKAFDLLLGDEHYTLTEAIYVAKLLRQITIGSPIANDRNYIVFGDPLMFFGMPARNVRITSLEPATLSALELTRVTGFVADATGSADDMFNGDIHVTVYDAERKKEKELDEGATLSYNLPGSRVFRGKGTVSNGMFDMQFIVPKDIAYGEASAKISGYALGGGTHAAGGLDSIEISGSNPVITDTTGPEINVTLASGAPLDGAVVQIGQKLIVELSDTSGINLSGEPEHGINVYFDDDRMNGITLTEDFAYYPDSYRSGSVDFRVPNIEAGSHFMHVKAWDSANNSRMKTYNMAVGKIEELVVSAIMNYPNPAETETRFSYYLSERVSQVRIDIYSLAGRLIRTLMSQPSDEGYNITEPWDITDFRGDRIANGVYIYRVTASGRPAFNVGGDADKAEGFGKIAVIR